VSSTVKDLVVGSGLTFDDRGPHRLKGVPDPSRLYAVAEGDRVIGGTAWADRTTEEGAMETTEGTLATIDRFNEAFNRFDVDAVMDMMTEDIVFENTAGPDGGRFEGQASVREYFGKAFETTDSGWFDAEEIFASGDRCVVRWDFVFDREDPRARPRQGDRSLPSA
jgi:ketosteroid isomerase-like protein